MADPQTDATPSLQEARKLFQISVRVLLQEVASGQDGQFEAEQCERFADALILAAQSAERPDPKGTTNCPVCGWNEPHQEHAGDAIRRLIDHVERLDLRYTELQRAAYFWWSRRKRPMAWGDKSHLADPTVNCANREEQDLGMAVARFEIQCGAKQWSAERPAQVIENIQNPDNFNQPVPRSPDVEGWQQVMIGGNHLASALIGIVGGNLPDYRESTFAVMREKFGESAADMWVAWKAIMDYRDTPLLDGEARVRRAFEERDRLRAALVGLVGADGRAELEQMETVMRTLPAAAEDKAVTIDAIHALLATIKAEPSAS